MQTEVLAALISGGSGLIGAMVGGLIAWFATSTLESRRWRREDSRRFDQQRRVAYVALLRSVAKLVSTHKQDLHLDSDVAAEWLTVQSEIELIASKEVCQATRSFSLAVSDQLFNPNPQLPVEQWGEARRKLVEAVREELGLTSTLSISRSDA